MVNIFNDNEMFDEIKNKILYLILIEGKNVSYKLKCSLEYISFRSSEKRRAPYSLTYVNLGQDNF